MPTAAVVYRSATGTTRRLAEEIGAHLESRGVDATVQSVGDATPRRWPASTSCSSAAGRAGCSSSPSTPTSRGWPSCASSRPWAGHGSGCSPRTSSPRAPCSRRMRAAVGSTASRIDLELKSANGHLSDAGRHALDRFVGRVAMARSQPGPDAGRGSCPGTAAHPRVPPRPRRVPAGRRPHDAHARRLAADLRRVVRLRRRRASG